MLKKIEIDKLSDCIKDEYDLFLCFNSFEDRCTSIIANIPKERFKFFLVLTNKNNLGNGERNLQQIQRILEGKEKIAYLDIASPLSVADTIINKLNEIELNGELLKVFIDITTFTHEILLMILAIFHDKYPNTKITCGYVNAESYSIDKDDPQKKWLSRGIGSVRSVLGYSGDFKPSQSNHLILIVGYEYDRAVGIINSIDPMFLTLGYNEADHATTDQHRDASAQYARLVRQMAICFDSINDFAVPCDNPYDAYLEICKYLDRIGKNVNITIVPMNNKLSTVGAALVGLTRPEIQISYAPALVYNTSTYSKAGNMCYLFPLRNPEKC